MSKYNKSMVLLIVLGLLLIVATRARGATFSASAAHTKMLLEESEGYFKHEGGTGGEGKPVVYVTNLNDSGPGSLRFYAEQGNLLIMFEDGVNGTINLSEEIKIESNTTLWGRTRNGMGAEIFIHPASDSDSAFKVRKERSNIIIANFKGDAAGPDDNAPTFVTIRGPGGVVWVHHISVLGDGTKDMDGFVDPQSKGVTISWNKVVDWDSTILAVPFDGVLPEATVHHNWFINGGGRHPRVVDGGKIHAYSNWVDGFRDNGMQAVRGGELRADGNILASFTDNDGIRGNWAGIGNVFEGIAAADSQSGGIFSPPYSYTLQLADQQLKDSLMANAGWQAFAIPEPPTWLGLVVGMVSGFVFSRWRRRR